MMRRREEGDEKGEDRTHLRDDEVVLDHADVIGVDGVRGHEDAGVELQDCRGHRERARRSVFGLFRRRRGARTLRPQITDGLLWLYSEGGYVREKIRRNTIKRSCRHDSKR